MVKSLSFCAFRCILNFVDFIFGKVGSTMPFIDVRTDKTISTEQENALKAELGSAIALIPGKSEDSLMVQFTDNCRMWFGGKQGNAAMVNVMLYGSAEKASYRAFSDRVIPG